MKKLASLFVLFFVVLLPLFAGSVLSPEHSFYTDAKRWYVMGYIDRLPDFKPYSLALVDSVLDQIIDFGPEEEVQIAQNYKYEIFYKPLNFGAEVKKNFSTGEDSLDIPMFGFADIRPIENLGFSYDIRELLTTKRLPKTPYFAGQSNDTVADPAHIGNMSFFLEGNFATSIGTEDFYFIGGLGRAQNSMSLEDSIVLTKNAFHSPYAGFVVNKENWGYSQSFHSIIPTNALGGLGQYLQKFYSVHNVDLKPHKKFTLSLIEMISYGHRFDFSYMIPSLYMVTQSFTGCGDNLIMGMCGDYKPFDGLEIYFQGMLDDVNVDELFKFDLDTRITGSGILGAVYVPENFILEYVSADLTMVTPWMYSHPDFSGGSLVGVTGLNMQNMLHNGYCMSSNINPNSWKLNLKTSMRPVENLKLDFAFSLVRHANVNESLPLDEAYWYLSRSKLNDGNSSYITDGTYNDHAYGYNGYYLNSYLSDFTFMEQDTKMTVLDFSINGEYKIFAGKWGYTTINVGYTFEYIRNLNVNKNIFPSKGLPSTADTSAKELAVKEAINDWKNNLIKDTFNNFLSISVKYVWPHW